MIKYRYFWLFIFGYAIGAENQANNSINVGIARSNSSKVMPDNIFEEHLNIFKKITGYEDFELNDMYWNALLHNSNKTQSGSLKQVKIKKEEQLSNIKNNKQEEKSGKNNNQKKMSNHKSNSNNNIITESSKTQINKNIYNNLNSLKKTSNTKNKNNNKKKKSGTFQSEDQLIEQAIKEDEKRLSQLVENAFVKNGNKIIDGYALYEKNFQNSEFSVTDISMLIEYFNVVTDFLQSDVSTEKEITKREELISVYKNIGQKLLEIGFFSESIEKKLTVDTSNLEENSGGESKEKNYITQEELERTFLAKVITKESLLNSRLIVGLRLNDLLNK